MVVRDIEAHSTFIDGVVVEQAGGARVNGFHLRRACSNAPRAFIFCGLIEPDAGVLNCRTYVLLCLENGAPLFVLERGGPFPDMCVFEQASLLIFTVCAYSREDQIDAERNTFKMAADFYLELSQRPDW